MKKVSVLAFIIIMFTGLNTAHAISPDWGSTGHRTIGKIASLHISKKAEREISRLLKGQSLALVSTFGDDIKSDKRYKEFYTWHYVNMPFDTNYEGSDKNSEGDLVVGIEKCKEIILDKNASEDDKAFYLKLLVHFMGDLHQPMHVGRAEDKGGNTYQVQWFGDGTNLHSVWDSKMIESYNMTYSELADNANKISKNQIEFLQQGSVVDWLNETHQLAKKVYGSAEVGEKLSYNYMYENFELVRQQLQIGGIRLAKVLNELFS